MASFLAQNLLKKIQRQIFFLIMENSVNIPRDTRKTQRQ